MAEQENNYRKYRKIVLANFLKITQKRTNLLIELDSKISKIS
jgi:hypothetical protein